MRFLKFLTVFTVISALMASCGHRGYTIIGDIIDLDEGNINLLDVSGRVISSSEVVDGKFTFKGKVDVPHLAYINNALGVKYPIDIPVLLENTVIKVSGDARIQHIDITGTKANENMVMFKVMKDRLRPDDRESYLKLVKDTFEENHDNVLGAMLISNLYTLVSDEELLDYCGRLSPEFLEDLTVKHYMSVAQRRVATAPGHPFVDFTLKDTDSVSVSLSAVVKANKATVLLFWASWARDAAKVIPAITSGCRPYQDKGLEMFNVSLDSDMEKNARCEEEFGLFGRIFANGPNKGNEASSLYGFEALPSLALIGQDGKIIARGRFFEDISSPLDSIFNQRPVSNE